MGTKLPSDFQPRKELEELKHDSQEIICTKVANAAKGVTWKDEIGSLSLTQHGGLGVDSLEQRTEC